MYIFTHGKKQPEPKVIEMSARIRSTPVALGGVLYVMTENHLFALKK
jgi:hypothetical protein